MEVDGVACDRVFPSRVLVSERYGRYVGCECAPVQQAGKRSSVGAKPSDR